MTKKDKERLRVMIMNIRRVIIVGIMAAAGLWYSISGKDSEKTVIVTRMAAPAQDPAAVKGDNSAATGRDAAAVKSENASDPEQGAAVKGNTSAASGQGAAEQRESMPAGDTGASGTETADTDGRIDINRADSEMLQRLPGIGPGIAGRILEYRCEHGSFRTTEELKRVKGIGDKTYAKLRDMVKTEGTEN